jgi:hypothetical protein
VVWTTLEGSSGSRGHCSGSADDAGVLDQPGCSTINHDLLEFNLRLLSRWGECASAFCTIAGHVVQPRGNGVAKDMTSS